MMAEMNKKDVQFDCIEKIIMESMRKLKDVRNDYPPIYVVGGWCRDKQLGL